MQAGTMRSSLPKVLLFLFFLVWAVLGVWIVLNAPYYSGTDESIKYVAFAAAKHRWATEADFRKYGIDHFYYPPLYFLLFAPFHSDKPAYVDRYPPGVPEDENYQRRSGRLMVSKRWLATIPPELIRLYREAKFVSLFFGLVVLGCIAAALWLLFPGPGRWWLVLGGTVPVLFLPQFLYYQTLCNNDTLVNALSAAALLCFIAAMKGGGAGDPGAGSSRRADRRLTTLSLGVAVCAGLAILTKMSGVMLLPLLPALAVGRYLLDESLPLRRRLRRAAVLLVVMAVVVVAAGGWWILYKAAQGDWNSSKAHQLAHPWAFRNISPEEVGKVVDQFWAVVRSYYGLFAGMIYGIPDWVFVAYVLLPFLIVLACLSLLAIAVRRGRPGRFWAPERRPESWLWIVLCLMIVFNCALVMYNTLTTSGAYGRFMFPTLVASHALFALLLSKLAAGRRRLLVTMVGLLIVYQVSLFAWTFLNRIVYAVLQPTENVQTLSFQLRGPKGWLVFAPPGWDFRIDQHLVVPSGRLLGFRVHVRRNWKLPVIGGALRGRVEFKLGEGRDLLVPIKRSPVGDNDATWKWSDLTLEWPVQLDKPTPAIIYLTAEPPWILPSKLKIYFPYVELGSYSEVGPFIYNGEMQKRGLAIAAVYDPANRPLAAP